MKFSKLKGRARERAIDEYRYVQAEYDCWWDFVYEDAVRMGALLGIEINERTRRQGTRTEIKEIDINFQLSYSQGDGSSFAGKYRPKADAIAAVKAETNDPELLRIAQELTVAQATAMVMDGSTFEASIKNNDRCIVVDVERSDDVDAASLNDGAVEGIEQAMKDFNDWIFAQLRAQEEWLTSDECVAEWIEANGIEFTREGDVKSRALATA